MTRRWAIVHLKAIFTGIREGRSVSFESVRLLVSHLEFASPSKPSYDRLLRHLLAVTLTYQVVRRGLAVAARRNVGRLHPPKVPPLSGGRIRKDPRVRIRWRRLPARRCFKFRWNLGWRGTNEA